MGILLQDLRFALRTLGRTPAFPLAAIGTLAIGIAATTAIFSTVNAALLKPLPYPNPGISIRCGRRSPMAVSRPETSRRSRSSG